MPEGAVGGSIITIAVPADNDASATSEVGGRLASILYVFRGASCRALVGN